MTKRETGTVKRFDKTKGYGFITPEYGKDIFVHQSALVDGQRIKEGDRVEFTVVQGTKGLQASDVIVVGTDS